MIMLAGSTEIVADTLSTMGLPGAVIATLLATISMLAGAIVVLFRMYLKQGGERKTEAAALIQLVERNNTALEKLADSTEERNRVTETLAKAIEVQAGAFELMTQRVDFYHEGNTEKLKDLRTVVESMADAVRANTGIVTDVRNSIAAVASHGADVKAKVDLVATKIDASLAARRGR